MSLPRIFFLASMPALCLSGCTKAKPEIEVLAKPVSTITLSSKTPKRQLKITGSISPYREERIAFEVSGRVTQVVDVGTDVEGETLKDDGQLVRAGDTLAIIDKTRYQLAFDSARLRLAARQEGLIAQRIDLEKVAHFQLVQAQAQLAVAESEESAAKANVEAAKARVTYAKQTFERVKKLTKAKTSTKDALDRARSDYDSASSSLRQAQASLNARQRSLANFKAGVAAAEAAIQLKKAELKATQAQLEELEQNVKRAQEDLDSCVLSAPFTGRISARHISRGAFVSPGTPVVTLTVFDPVKISFAVSAEKNKRIHFGDPVRIRPRGQPDGPMIPAVVDQKGEVADPATRTFRIDAVARNVPSKLAAGSADAVQLTFKTDIFIAVTDLSDPQKRAFLPVRSLLKEQGKLYVLKVPGRIDEGLNKWGKPFKPKKVEVKLGPAVASMSNFYCQQLAPESELRAGDFIIVDPKRALDDKGQIRTCIQNSKAWKLRPGDLVHVDMKLGQHRRGFLVPVEAVVTRNNKTWLYALVDGKAKRVDVEVGEHIGRERYVQSDELKDGLKIIVKGRHYIRDGEAVRDIPNFLER